MTGSFRVLGTSRILSFPRHLHRCLLVLAPRRPLWIFPARPPARRPAPGSGCPVPGGLHPRPWARLLVPVFFVCLAAFPSLLCPPHARLVPRDRPLRFSRSPVRTRRRLAGRLARWRRALP
eukprot:scaffold1401_cov330-Pavlova_lutheri.AAC.21